MFVIETIGDLRFTGMTSQQLSSSNRAAGTLPLTRIDGGSLEGIPRYHQRDFRRVSGVGHRPCCAA